MANPVEVIIAPEAVIDWGLTAFEAVEGLGLNTFGFLWPEDGIWAPCCPVNEGTAPPTWVDCEGCL